MSVPHGLPARVPERRLLLPGTISIWKEKEPVLSRTDERSFQGAWVRADRDDLPIGFLRHHLCPAGEVGNAAKMMLIVNMVQGSFMATIAEGLTLAQVTGQSQQTLLDILNQGQLASIFLDQKCQSKSPLASLLEFLFSLELSSWARSSRKVLSWFIVLKELLFQSVLDPVREGPETQ